MDTNSILSLLAGLGLGFLIAWAWKYDDKIERIKKYNNDLKGGNESPRDDIF